MVSVSSLLNPAPSGASAFARLHPSSSSSSSPACSSADETLLDIQLSVMNKPKMPKESASFTKSRPKGVVHFLPYEALDPDSLCEVRKFQVYPLGSIHECCRHIPYNSGKKDFYEKTGRESFEVFHYDFKVPGDDTDYTVMWDYNVGLVRMTPFFKCCKYSKTTPAKMLNLNPGLRDITHSITGGAIVAQGYWMPYRCARAVCATFCHHIAGALIPIFGPDFPADCINPDMPGYGRMIIDPGIVADSTRDAEKFRHMFMARSIGVRPTSSPQRDGRSMPCQSNPYTPAYRSMPAYAQFDPHSRLLGKGFPGPASPYGSDTDVDTGIDEYSPGPTASGSLMPISLSQVRVAAQTVAVPSPALSSASGWATGNSGHYHTQATYPPDQRLPYQEQACLYGPNATANPILTAIPRAASLSHFHNHHHQQQQQQRPHQEQYQQPLHPRERHYNVYQPPVPSPEAIHPSLRQQQQQPLLPPIAEYHPPLLLPPTTQPPQPPTTPAAQNNTRGLLSHPPPPPPWHLSKRAADGRGAGDDAYDGDSSQSASPDTASMTPPSTAAEREEPLDLAAARSGVDKNAALLLMHLSVRDAVPGEEGMRRQKEMPNAPTRAHDRIPSADMAAATAPAAAESPAQGRTAVFNAALSGAGTPWHGDRHSRKRRRASSM